jgi:hypothetical protein
MAFIRAMTFLSKDNKNIVEATVLTDGQFLFIYLFSHHKGTS